MLLSRAGELTAVARRDGFDALPGDVTDPVDKDRWEQFRARYHSAMDLRLEFPLQLDFELNSTCQMRCSFCTHGQQKVSKRFLTFDEFCRVIDEGAEYGLCSIKLNYINEPLLNKDLPRFIRYAKSKGVLNVYFATNGLLLKPAMAEALIEAGATKIMVSLDATTAGTFEKMRHSARFDEIVENVRYLIKVRNALGLRWPLVRVNFVKTLLNYHEADEFMATWTGVADMIGYQDQVAVPGAGQELLRDKDMTGFRCAFPARLMVIDSGGNILPCCTFSGRRMAMGSIRSGTVKMAWDSFNMRRLQELHRTGEYRQLPICVECVGC